MKGAEIPAKDVARIDFGLINIGTGLKIEGVLALAALGRNGIANAIEAIRI